MNTTHKIDPNQREDLRNVYLAIHASAITTTIPEIAAKTGLKRQYVVELVEVLKSHADRNGDAFVIVNSKPGENGNEEPHDWLQTWHTVDDHADDDAQHWFDEHFPVTATPEKEAKAPAPRTPLNATNPAGLPMCLCGCQQPVANRSRNYKPGHDARHAGVVARYIAAEDGGEDVREAALAMLPTEALRLKADAMATRLLKKAAVREANMTPEKLAKEMVKSIEKVTGVKMDDAATGPGPKVHTPTSVPKVEFEVGEVKIGRWVYPAERNSTSGSVTFTRKGKTEVASDKVAASFKSEA